MFTLPLLLPPLYHRKPHLEARLQGLSRIVPHWDPAVVEVGVLPTPQHSEPTTSHRCGLHLLGLSVFLHHLPGGFPLRAFFCWLRCDCSSGCLGLDFRIWKTFGWLKATGIWGVLFIFSQQNSPKSPSFWAKTEIIFQELSKLPPLRNIWASLFSPAQRLKPSQRHWLLPHWREAGCNSKCTSRLPAKTKQDSGKRGWKNHQEPFEKKSNTRSY